MAGRRDRSRSPVRLDMSRRREANENNKPEHPVMPNAMNPLMMANLYPPAGNIMMGGMYNMMMGNSLLGGAMMPSSMDMMASTGLDVMAQPPIDISSIAAQPMPPPGPPMDMSMMGGVIMDPSMMAMYPSIPNIPPQEVPQDKKEVNLKYSKLSPPLPSAHQPPKRSKPPGCRTIFVSGLPDKIREKVLAEIFERFGRIQVLRLSKKNFCHIRFDRENCVDAAMAISGYSIKLKDKDKDEVDEDDDSHAVNGFIHVDYALSRDDQNEYERRQRQAFRVQQQQMQELNAQQEAISNQNQSYPRSPSPVRIQPFSNAAIVQLSEKIKAEDQFSNSLPTLLAWLERGECSKRNSNQFYSMIQATNSHIRRLYQEKLQHEEELQNTKERVKTSIQHIIQQLEQVAKVFSAATHQRVWDHFTKPQRKNIETWQKMTQEFQALKEEFNDKFHTEDMEIISNGYGGKSMFDGDTEEMQKLKRENESLQFQLEAYKNEIDVIKADAHTDMEKFKAQYRARQALTGATDNNPPLPSPVAKPPPPPPPPLPDDVESKAGVKDEVEVGCGEARLIGVMSAFLQVHPQGASLDYVVSYVRALWAGATQASVHRVLQRHADVFQPRTTGVGANIDTRWFFVAFQPK